MKRKSGYSIRPLKLSVNNTTIEESSVLTWRTLYCACINLCKIVLIVSFVLKALPEKSGFAADEMNQPKRAIRAEWPGVDFTLAYDDFKRKDFAAASGEIRKAADFLNMAAERSSGRIKQDLISVHMELEQLADDTANGKIISPVRLRKSFALAHNVLAEYYHQRLNESWLKKDTQKAGKELLVAASNLERGVAWAGGEIEAKTERVIREARELGETITQKGGSSAEEFEEKIKEVGEEINKLKDRIKENPGE